jgi:hypothetical protein
MSLGRRCDEIVRLIDETLLSIGADPGTPLDIDAHPSAASLRRLPTDPGGRDRRGAARLHALPDLEATDA